MTWTSLTGNIYYRTGDMITLHINEVWSKNAACLKCKMSWLHWLMFESVEIKTVAGVID